MKLPLNLYFLITYLPVINNLVTKISLTEFYIRGLLNQMIFLNPNYALDFVMKTKDTIKLKTHRLFLDEQYFCVLNLKIEIITYFEVDLVYNRTLMRNLGLKVF